MTRQVKRKILAITGRPGIGKTTLALSIADSIKERGFVVGGFISPEIRTVRGREGFSIKNLLSGESITLASRHRIGELTVGRYFINKESGSFISRAISDAISAADVILLDEIGPMELKVKEGEFSIISALNSGKPILATFYYKLRFVRPSVFSIISTGMILEVNQFNRDSLMERAKGYAGWLLYGTIGN